MFVSELQNTIVERNYLFSSRIPFLTTSKYYCCSKGSTIITFLGIFMKIYDQPDSSVLKNDFNFPPEDKILRFFPVKIPIQILLSNVLMNSEIKCHIFITQHSLSGEFPNLAIFLLRHNNILKFSKFHQVLGEPGSVTVSCDRLDQNTDVHALKHPTKIITFILASKNYPHYEGDFVTEYNDCRWQKFMICLLENWELFG